MSSKDWWIDLISKLLTVSNIEIDDKQKLKEFSKFAYDEFGRDNCWTKYENCDLVLNVLKAKGYKLGIVSNFDERLPAILTNLKLNQYFDFILTPNECNGLAKPNKEVFLKAFELGLNGSKNTGDYMHIGDSIELDYSPAKSLNFKSLLLLHDPLKTHTAEFFKIKNENMHANDLIDLYKKIIRIF
jgi:HAD superfamily hydrolase (TIGR01549 family)